LTAAHAASITLVDLSEDFCYCFPWQMNYFIINIFCAVKSVWTKRLDGLPRLAYPKKAPNKDGAGFDSSN
jgi:hypothetical protein